MIYYKYQTYKLGGTFSCGKNHLFSQCFSCINRDIFSNIYVPKFIFGLSALVYHFLFKVPRTGENYVHRSGRTARANNSGIAIILMEPSEDQFYLKICKTLTKHEKFPLFPVSKVYIKAIKERVDLAREIDIMELNLKREKSQAGWFKKTADAMEIVLEHFS